MLTLNSTTYPTIQVGPHEFAKVAMADFLATEPAPIQRDGQRRVASMKSIFNQAYAAQQPDTLTEVVVGVVEQDFEDRDHETGVVIGRYSQGQVFVLDGNTRRHFWLCYPDMAQQHESLTVKIHKLRSMTDMQFAYYPYNNKASVEKAGHLLQGLARRYNWQPRQSLFAGGGYKTALDWASGSSHSVEANFNEYFDELVKLDQLPRGNKPTISKPAIRVVKSQPIVAAVLMMLKKYPNNLMLFDLIERLCTQDMDQLKQTALVKGRVDAVEIILAEWSGLSRVRKTTECDPWLGGIAGTTKFSAREPQLDFLLYWMEEYISNPQNTRDFSCGVKPSHWAGHLETFFSQD